MKFLSFFHLVEDEIDAPGYDALRLGCGSSLHGVGLTAAGLPVCEDAHILAVHSSLDKLA